jgi:hypothetical protein
VAFGGEGVSGFCGAGSICSMVRITIGAGAGYVLDSPCNFFFW